MSAPNILFLMTDQLRADHVGWARDARMATPNLDRLAAGGCVFDRARTVNPVCQPARSALLTGKYPRQIHTLAMGQNDLSPRFATYPQALQRAGYRTIGIGKFHFLHGTKTGPEDLEQVRAYHRQLGFEEVWEASGKELQKTHYSDWTAQMEQKGRLEEYLEQTRRLKGNAYHWKHPLDDQWVPGEWGLDEEDYVDVATARQIIEKLRDPTLGERPFFLFGSFCGPHPPYDPPVRYLEMFPLDEDEPIISPRDLSASEVHCVRELRRRYKAMIKLIDDQVGLILDALEESGLAEKTALVFTADHGEFLGDHAKFDKMRPQGASVNVPLAVRLPGVPREGERVGGGTGPGAERGRQHRHDGLVELTDLTATILDIAGLDPQQELGTQQPGPFHDRVPGRSLLPIAAGRSAEPVREDAFSEFAGVWSSVETANWKYVRHQQGPDLAEPPWEELFALVQDPGELTNLAGEPACRDILADMRNRLLTRLDWAAPGQFLTSL